METSPCIDQGTDLEWIVENETLDLAGLFRKMNRKTDMGAYESQSVPAGTIYMIR